MGVRVRVRVRVGVGVGVGFRVGVGVRVRVKVRVRRVGALGGVRHADEGGVVLGGGVGGEDRLRIPLLHLG